MSNVELVTGNNIEIVPTADIVLSTVGKAEITTEVDNSLALTATKKEYKIVGDEVYIAKLYEDAPQWMRDLVQLVVDNTMASESTALLNSLVSQLNQFAASYVPLNTYTQSIIDLSNANMAMHGTLETLNSNFNDGLNNANSQIINLQTTKASKDEVATKVVETLTAQLLTPTSELGATIANLQQAIVTGDSANADSITTLTSTLEGEVDARATATEYLNTYVGINSSGTATGTGLLANVEILQKQADGAINTYSDIYDVMLGIEDSNNNTDNDQLVMTAEPYASWLAEDTLNGNENVRLAHIGDVYIKYRNTTAGAKEYIASYKFIKTVVDNTSPYATDAEGFTWALIVDQAAQDAYQQALKARDLADGKRRVFVGLGADSTPKVPYDQGDLWLIDAIRVVNGYNCKVGDILRCVETKGEIGVYEQNDWVLASSYANAVEAQNQQFQNFVNTDYAAFTTGIQEQVDKKAETFYQSSVPTGRITSINVAANATLDKYVGDIWKNTYAGTVSTYLGNNTEYIYTKTANGSNWDYKWTKMEIPDSLFDTLDTKKAIYSGNSLPAPTAPDTVNTNDIWITGDAPVGGRAAKSIYIWDGDSWEIPVKYTDDTAVTTLQSGLENGTVTIKLTNAYIGETPLTDYLAEELDGLVTVFSGTNHTAQTGMENGDIYIEKTTANSTGGITVDVVNTWKYNGTSWVQIGNNNNITALADLADGKRTVFSGNAVPTGAVERDIWIPNADVSITTSGMCIVAGGSWNGTTCSITKYVKGEVYQYLTSKWLLATRYTENLDAFVDVIEPKVDTLQNQVDGKIEYFFFTTYNQAGTIVAGSASEAAALVKVKAQWTTTTAKEQANGNVVYFKDSTKGYWYASATDSWQTLTDTSMMQALKKAEDARAVADEKVAVYFAIEQSTAPAAPGTTVDTIGGKAIVVPFYWYDTTNLVLKSYVASAWTAVPMTAANDGDQMQSMVVDTAKHTVDYYTREYSNASTPKWIVRTPNGYVASSAWGVNLDAYLGGRATGGTTTLVNDITTTSDSSLNSAVNSRFAYNSNLVINGTTYNSGFGLSNSTGTGIGSEFWIDASRLKFTNSAKTGSKAPFTIDDSGTTPQITFNGKVTFTNVTEAPTATRRSTFPGVNIGTGYTVTKAGVHVIYLYSTGAASIDVKVNNTIISSTPPLNKQALVYATPALSVGNVVTVAASGTVVAYISNPEEIGATAPGTQWYIPAYSTTLVAGSNGQFVIGSSSATGDIIKGINGTTNTTTIDGGMITTGSIKALQINAGSVTADRLSPTSGNSTVWSGGGLVSSNFNGNVVGSIGTPTQGFRLSSNAAGTSEDPSIYGAYIKGVFIESLYSPVAGTSNSGRFNYAASGTELSVISPTSGIGYASNRITSLSNSVLVVRGFAEVLTNAISTFDVSRHLQRSIDNGPYTTIQTKRYYHDLPPASGMDSQYVFITITVTVTVTVYVNGSMGSGSGSGSGSGGTPVNVLVTVFPTMAIAQTLEFFYVEDLQNLGSFNTLSYRVTDGIVMLTLHN